MIKCQYRNCGRILNFNKVKNPKVINNFETKKEAQEHIDNMSLCYPTNSYEIVEQEVEK